MSRRAAPLIEAQVAGRGDRLADPLAAVGLFAAVEPASRIALAAAGRLVARAKGQEVDGGDGACLAVLLEGSVALAVRNLSQQAVLSTALAPRALNLACVMVEAGCDIRWRALEPSLFLLLPTPVFRAALDVDHALAGRAFAEIAQAFQDLLSGAAGQRLHSARRRVAGYLLSLVDVATGEARVRLPHEKHLLASLLGMTPENFSRALARLTDYGVTVRGMEILIAAVERLEADLDGL